MNEGESLELSTRAAAGEGSLPNARVVWVRRPHGDRLPKRHATAARTRTHPRPPCTRTPPDTRVLEPLKELKDAIASYAGGVIGTMNERDADSVAAAAQQLEPILRARRAVASGEATTEEPSEPVETPLPDLPPAIAAAAASAGASA